MANVNANDVLIKASPLRSVLDFMNTQLNAEGRTRVLDRAAVEFPAETARVRKSMPIASDRFQVVFLNRVMELVADELHQPQTVVAHRIGRQAAKDASTGVMRLAMTLLSIPALLRKLSPVWSQMYSHGVMKNEFHEKSATVELQDFPIASKAGCARITGTLEWFGEQAEKNFHILHTECRANGAPTCRWQLRW